MTKALSILLALKKEKHQYVVQADNGMYTTMSVGTKGTVRELSAAVAQELFGETELSDENHKNFLELTKMKLPRAKKTKEEKSPSPAPSQSKQESLKKAGIV